MPCDDVDLYKHVITTKELRVSVSHASAGSSGVLGLAGVLPDAWAVRELVSMLGTVADPRKRRGVRHRLATVLAVAVFAVLAGAKTYRQVGDRVADLPQPLLALAGARSCPTLGVVQAPSGATIRRVLIAVDTGAVDRVVGSWLASLLVTDRESLLGLAIDAKTVRDAGTIDGEVQLFSAMAHGAAIVVGQVRVPAGTTEVTQVRALLDGLDLDARVVTADAAHAQHDTADYLVAERGDDVLQVKANQPGLLRQITDVLAPGRWWPTPTAAPSSSATATPYAGRCGSPTPTRSTFPRRRGCFDCCGNASTRSVSGWPNRSCTG